MQDSEFCVNDYYPGQQFRGELGDLDSANWIKSTANHSQAACKKNHDKEVTITVEKVGMSSRVQALSCAAFVCNFLLIMLV